jgi:hypothetical protein
MTNTLEKLKSNLYEVKEEYWKAQEEARKQYLLGVKEGSNPCRELWYERRAEALEITLSQAQAAYQSELNKQTDIPLSDYRGRQRLPAPDHLHGWPSSKQYKK